MIQKLGQTKSQNIVIQTFLDKFELFILWKTVGNALILFFDSFCNRRIILNIFLVNYLLCERFVLFGLLSTSLSSDF